MPPKKSDHGRTSLPSQASAPSSKPPQETAQNISQASSDTPQRDAPVPNTKPTSNTKPKISKLSDNDDSTTIEDLSLPKSIVTRLAKGVLPPNTQIQANAILAMQKGSTVFISYISSLAAEIATTRGRKTISPQDVLEALQEGEFGMWNNVLEEELKTFNRIQSEKRGAYRSKLKAKEKEESAGEKGSKEDSAGRGSKKARLDGNNDVTSTSEQQKIDQEEENVMDEDDATAEAQLDEEVEEAEDENNEPQEGEAEEEESSEDESLERGDDAEDNQEDEDDRDEALDNGEDSD